MTREEAKNILLRLDRDPNIADQFTEEEIQELEKIANSSK